MTLPTSSTGSLGICGSDTEVLRRRRMAGASFASARTTNLNHWVILLKEDTVDVVAASFELVRA